ncbi:hypothetical protein [Bdellovibrio sp. KM01]|uniref:hypothetical protein n=1 Tax=Bdellovibrio sp. KM01 TaxID=2748865 RepID=UPI0015E924D7|nr:hypothetical protein [Bdellovibrio sp. KM01]QLY25743.1 hypothetical protein HW988_01445 [Bdellovibrio sp. KM01]
MNKDLLIAFALGILVGWGVFKFTTPNPTSAGTETAQVATDESTAPAQNNELPGGDIPPPPETAESNAAPMPNGTPMATPPTTGEVVHRNINLELTEDAVDMLEQSITDLHQSVTVERDNEGFILHFDNPDNYFASIGLANNDRIPFTQFEEMRQNPETQELASRIETLLSNLEK